MYDEDYLYFFAAPPGRSEFAVHGPVVPGAYNAGGPAAELAWRLLELRQDMSVLDLACGHGDLANRLAACVCRVTGLDSSAVFLDRARADAAAAGVSVQYVAGDMRQIPWTSRFDPVINWSTAFGYFDDLPTAPSWTGSSVSCGQAADWPWLPRSGTGFSAKGFTARRVSPPPVPARPGRR